MAADGETPAKSTESTEHSDLRTVLDQLLRVLAAAPSSVPAVPPTAQDAALARTEQPDGADPGGEKEVGAIDPPSRLDTLFGRMTAAWLAPVATGLVTCAVTLFLVSATRPALPSPGTEIAVFDVDAAMSRLITRPDVAALSPDDPKFAEVVTGYHTALVAEFDRYAREQGVVVISATAVLGGSPKDSTGELVDRALAAIPTVTPTASTTPSTPAPSPSAPPPAPALGP